MLRLITILPTETTMATISSEYDTKTKKLTVTKDGKKMPYVHSLSFDKMYDTYDKTEGEAKHQMMMSQRNSDNKDEGYMTHTHTNASEDGELVTTEEAPANQGLANFINKFLKRTGK